VKPKVTILLYRKRKAIFQIREELTTQKLNMAEALKDRYFQRPFFAKLLKEIVIQYPVFDQISFYNNLFDDSWGDKPLKEMLMHSAKTLRDSLPADYLETLNILKPICHKFGDFDAMIFPDVVRQFGMDHYTESMSALELFTQYSTAEFAIRPYILRYEEKAMKQMLLWSKHPNEHVRRLASEGCRPRLPWAMGLPIFKKNPSLILPILENLKSDSSLYVRKSVANNWNDLTKDNPNVVLDTFKKWNYGATAETQWIMKHALRSLVKAGDSQALNLMGFEQVKTKVSNLRITPSKIKVGEKINFSFQVHNESDKPVELMIDYLVHFRKANGKTTPKVFKIKAVSLDIDEQINISKNHDFKLINTRRYYPGIHAIQIQVNGEKLEVEDFELVS
jgi:3-methyladenine DNA glycosylase AlkC